MTTRDERRAEAKATLAEAKALLARHEGRAHVEYQIAGLVAELEDGLARLERADQADDHVAYYRRGFHHAVRDLRRELDSPTPDIHALALAAMQAAWLARIWPVLHAARQQWRGPDRFKSTNATRKTDETLARTRCLAIARTLARPTSAAVQRHYRTQFPRLTVPSDRSIRRYLATLKK